MIQFYLDILRINFYLYFYLALLGCIYFFSIDPYLTIFTNSIYILYYFIYNIDNTKVFKVFYCIVNVNQLIRHNHKIILLYLFNIPVLICHPAYYVNENIILGFYFSVLIGFIKSNALKSVLSIFILLISMNIESSIITRYITVFFLFTHIILSISKHEYFFVGYDQSRKT